MTSMTREDPTMPTSRPGLLLLLRGLGSLLALSGLALVAGSIRLSEAELPQLYLFAGLTLVLGGALLLLRRLEALALYALMMLLAGAWALIEPGIDGWRLLPGLVLWLTLGLLLLPFNRLLGHHLERTEEPR